MCGVASYLLAATGCKRQDHLAPRAVLVETRERTGGEFSITAASFNIRNEAAGDVGVHLWPARVAQVVREVRRISPDLLGLQEVLHGQAADLRASLPDYEFFGTARDDGKRAGEYAAVFYRKGKFDIDLEESTTFWLSATPEVAGSRTWGNDLPRIATWLHLTDRATGRGFYCVNSHWDHRNQHAREMAARLLAERVTKRRHKHEPVVLMGDFNANESNPAVAYLTGRKVLLAGRSAQWNQPLVDTFQALHGHLKNRRTLHFWSGSHEGSLKVDHILVTQGARISTSTISYDAAPYASDHFAVSAHFIFP